MIEHFIVLVLFNKFANFDVFYDIMIISSRAALKKNAYVLCGFLYLLVHLYISIV